MLQKLALAVKTKTIEFFAEEEDDDDRSSIAELCLDEEVITGQRVVVIKPDKPGRPSFALPPSSPPPRSPSTTQSRRLFLVSLAPSLFASVSAFHAAYLQLQTAQEPFQLEAIEAADRSAVSHLQRLSELKKACYDQPGNPNSAALPSELEAQVLENQSLLRKYETAFNRLQADIDRKDAEVSALRQQLKEIEGSNALIRKKVEKSCGFNRKEEETERRERAFLTVGVFESIFKECCRTAHRFAKVLIRLMKDSGWDLESAANSIHPNVNYAKRGHCKYVILSYICMCMFEGFGSFDLEELDDGFQSEGSSRLKEFVSQFVRQLTVDSLELLDAEPDGEFARFCTAKYEKLIHPMMRESLAGNLDWREPGWDCFNPLYEPFVLMSNAVWMLHKMALAFGQPVEIFQVARGTDFSIVYMDAVVRGATSMGSGCGKTRPTVAFTVIPGFYLGRMVIQCKVYLDCVKCPL